MITLFAIKHKPKNLDEYVNQKEVVDQFLRWIKKRRPGKALLFHGPPGTGKTALVEAYCREKNLDLIQLNASDYRSATQIREVLGGSTQQASLFKKGKVFMIDEIDGLAGREDIGGAHEIIKIIKESIYPIVLTANDPWNKKLRSLRQHCQLVQFKKISVWDIEKRLKQICAKEKIKFDTEVLRELAKHSEGDLRAAINDLERISAGKNAISLADLKFLERREKELSIFDALKIIFKTQNTLAAKLSINNVDKDPDEIFWWIENNIPNEYEEHGELIKAYDMLSKADLFRQWIRSRQNWRFLSYMVDLMTAGVSVSKKDMYRKFTRYQYPRNMIVLGRSKLHRHYSEQVFLKLSKEFHCSSSKFKKEYLPYLRITLKNKKMQGSIANSLNLTKDELILIKTAF